MPHTLSTPMPYFLKPGYVVANAQAMLVRLVLGNCVAVTLFDRRHRFGGVHHFIFPRTRRQEDATAQYGNVGLPALYRTMKDLGADDRALVAQILGGAMLPDHPDENLGERNIDVARKALAHFGIPVISEDVGGTLGRKVVYHTGTNQTAIFRADDLRRSDWFRPGMDLRYHGPDR